MTPILTPTRDEEQPPGRDAAAKVGCVKPVITKGVACLACGTPKLSAWFTKLSAIDRRTYPFSRCASCGSVFVVPRPTPEYLEAYYSGATSSHAVALGTTSDVGGYKKVLADEAAFPNSSVDSERVARNCRELSRGSRFLDVGAGYGFFSRSALKHGFQVTAIEPTEMCRKVYKLMNGFGPLSGMLSDNFVCKHAGSFDVVLMSQVLEHIADLESTLTIFSTLLSSDGIVAIAVPHFGSWLSRIQGERDMFFIPPEHLNHFTKAGLASLFQRHGFSCIRMHTVSRINMDRVARKVPIPLVGKIAAKSILTLMQLSDSAAGGMFLNAYFRKSPAASRSLI
jgi:SAM-dependent methyltransferase